MSIVVKKSVAHRRAGRRIGNASLFISHETGIRQTSRAWRNSHTRSIARISKSLNGKQDIAGDPPDLRLELMLWQCGVSFACGFELRGNDAVGRSYWRDKNKSVDYAHSERLACRLWCLFARRYFRSTRGTPSTGEARREQAVWQAGRSIYNWRRTTETRRIQNRLVAVCIVRRRVKLVETRNARDSILVSL